ncbi:MAG: roadblock/LC7 domain-containing protein [Candidatus Thorarchaeota archaeon]
MSAKIKKIEDILKQLESDSEVEGSALVSERGQLMAAALHRGVDEKAVSAMAAALVSIGGRVGSALDSGDPKNIVIEGKDKMVIVRKVAKAALIATAPSGAKIGLIDFEMDKATEEINSIL